MIDTPLKPDCLEELAQSYAVLIRNKGWTLEDVLPAPPQLRERVEYLTRGK